VLKKKKTHNFFFIPCPAKKNMRALPTCCIVLALVLAASARVGADVSV
jgi:hypothetical protein